MNRDWPESEQKTGVRPRFFWYQVLVCAALVGLALWLARTTQANLARLGVDTSFDFLWQRAGFEISQTLVAYDADSSVARALLVAFLNTAVLSVAIIGGATLLGLVVGLARLSKNWLVARLATCYVELLRNVPALLHVFFWYFVALRALPRTPARIELGGIVWLDNRGLALPLCTIGDGGAWLVAGLALAILVAWIGPRMLGARSRGALMGLGVLGAIVALSQVPFACSLPHPGKFGVTGGLVIQPEFLALAIGLSLYQAAYVAEVVRSAVAAIPRGQLEAASALGLDRAARMRYVILPQALAIMLPPLITIYLNAFKGTALAAAIAYPEVVSVFVGTVNNLVGQPVVIMAVTLLVYASVSLLVAGGLYLVKGRWSGSAP